MASKYLEFVEMGESPSGKTKIWSVMNSNDGSLLGQVKWYGPWRKYVFFSEPNCIWSADCLEDLSKFVNQKMKEKQRGN